jgi:hypothetical protein
VAALLLAALLPGVAEVVENAVHLALRGHLAHAAPAGDDHETPADEHGCSGTVHVCQCCTSASFTLTAGILVDPPDRDQAGARPFSQRMLNGTLRDIEHPPRA